MEHMCLPLSLVESTGSLRYLGSAFGRLRAKGIAERIRRPECWCSFGDGFKWFVDQESLVSLPALICVAFDVEQSDVTTF